MMPIVREIYARSGWRGFFVGWGPCVLRSLPVNATTFLVYELVMQLW